MDDSESMLFAPTCVGGIVVEFLENNSYLLTTTEYPLPSSDISYEYVTLTSEHSPAASKIFLWFRSAISFCNSENGGLMINEMVEVFRNFKEELSIPLREYILSEGVVKVCYRVDIEDSLLMKQVRKMQEVVFLHDEGETPDPLEGRINFHVLDLLYESWASFGSLHFSAILKPGHFQQLDGRSQHRKQDFLSFYLEHARRLKLEYHGVRFADVSVYCSIRKAPVFIAAEILCWKPLLRYLQYGAKFENVMVDPGNTRNEVQSALADTFRSLIRHLWVRLVQPAIARSLTEPDEIEEYCRDITRELRDLCRTIKIMLRAVKRLRLDPLEFVIHDRNDQLLIEISSLEVLSHPTVQLLLPTLRERYSRPIRLQHSCRWVVRNRLNENWQLPSGIGTLPIPRKMKKYLNLLSG